MGAATLLSQEHTNLKENEVEKLLVLSCDRDCEFKEIVLSQGDRFVQRDNERYVEKILNMVIMRTFLKVFGFLLSLTILLQAVFAFQPQHPEVANTRGGGGRGGGSGSGGGGGGAGSTGGSAPNGGMNSEPGMGGGGSGGSGRGGPNGGGGHK